jgi:radical S-adenosyl methionine domain-containing protein 2
LAKVPHLRLKVNTVVTRLNLHDDMRPLIRRLRPARWKVFQVLPVQGQNDGVVEPLLITRAEFETYVARHRELDAEGIGPVAEDNQALTGTYLMLDALGRFFSNRTGEHVYTESILDVGVWGAVRQVGWDVEGFLARGGLYRWGSADAGDASD